MDIINTINNPIISSVWPKAKEKYRENNLEYMTKLPLNKITEVIIDVKPKQNEWVSQLTKRTFISLLNELYKNGNNSLLLMDIDLLSVFQISDLVQTIKEEIISDSFDIRSYICLDTNRDECVLFYEEDNKINIINYKILNLNF